MAVTVGGLIQFLFFIYTYIYSLIKQNKKKDRDEKYIERFVAKLGNEPDINILLDLLRLKDRLLENI